MMQELGLTRLQRDAEPFMLGLTATPYRGSDEYETRRLANRYGNNRLGRRCVRERRTGSRHSSAAAHESASGGGSRDHRWRGLLSLTRWLTNHSGAAV